ncbi:MAG: DUF1848 family protein [Phascolarctobacterium faecium]
MPAGRTDIPAFYWEWFQKRLQEQYVLVRNPLNLHQVSRISLRPEVGMGWFSGQKSRTDA